MRKIILLICSFLFVNQSFISSAAPAHNKIDPRKFVTYFVDETLKIIHKPKIDDKQITTESIPLMDSHVATEAIAKFSVGPRYRELNTKQKENFLKSFRNMLASRFSSTLKSALDKYKSIDAKFVVNTVKVVEEGRNYIVASTISISKDVIVINWSVFVVNGALRIFNMNVGGVNLGQVLRDEIGGNIKQVGLEKFLKDFQEKYGN